MCCRILTLTAVTLLLVGAAPDESSDRPTGIEVRDAVAQSIAEYKELHPTVTQAEAKAKVNNEVQQARAKLAAASRIRSPKQRAAALKAANAEIEALVAEANAIVKDYRQEDRNRLMPLQLKALSIGMVGRLTEQNQSADGIGYEHRFVRCLKPIDKTEMLAQLEYQETSASGDAGDEPLKKTSPKFMLKGVAAATENQLLKGVYDVVVTGEYSYEDDSGENQTVYVLEVFDPNKPFQ